MIILIGIAKAFDEIHHPLLKTLKLEIERNLLNLIVSICENPVFLMVKDNTFP